MPLSDARKRANQKWDQEHMKEYKRILVIIKKEKDQIIKDRSKQLNKSISKYINDLIDQDLKEGD